MKQFIALIIFAILLIGSIVSAANLGPALVTVHNMSIAPPAGFKQEVFCSDWKEEYSPENGLPILIAYNSSNNPVLVIPLTQVVCILAKTSCPSGAINMDDYTP